MLFYIDQSGSYHHHDNNKYIVTAAIAFEKDVIRDLARGLYKLNEVYWKTKNPYDFEMKGQLLLNPRAIKHPKNCDYASEVLILCRQGGGIAFAIIEPKPTQEAFESLNQLILPKSYKYLFERIGKCCLGINLQEKGLMIFDSQDMRKNEILSRRMSNFFYRSKAGVFMNNIIPEPYFVSSNICYGIQIADLIAYIVGQRFAGRTELIPLYKQIKEIEFQCLDDDIEYPIHGIKHIKEESPKEELASDEL